MVIPKITLQTGMKHTFVSSSNIHSVAYDRPALKLQVQMKHGKLYEYDDVLPDTHEGLMNSPSMGSYFHKNIRTRFTSREVS